MEKEENKKRPVIDFSKPWPESERKSDWVDSVIRNGKSNLLPETDEEKENPESIDR